MKIIVTYGPTLIVVHSNYNVNPSVTIFPGLSVSFPLAALSVKLLFSSLGPCFVYLGAHTPVPSVIYRCWSGAKVCCNVQAKVARKTPASL